MRNGERERNWMPDGPLFLCSGFDGIVGDPMLAWWVAFPLFLPGFCRSSFLTFQPGVLSGPSSSSFLWLRCCLLRSTWSSLRCVPILPWRQYDFLACVGYWFRGPRFLGAPPSGGGNVRRPSCVPSWSVFQCLGIDLPAMEFRYLVGRGNVFFLHPPGSWKRSPGPLRRKTSGNP
ncbi:hypothetical protein BGZ61DRAFT_447278 [Ilyonectria robusta]|uniref:uncharacterized protein n=1 Tax=Ilyonectria robusta TaxID=1079257 RepID=UPI001E8D26DC|nr:uncharacterized protein BGZ61DRAFT_447278 [Ilyonectria robusta]KAH8721598.1 hypothetical protein BGZ61DRAFT_447278 [Ilyonectria robusta]